MSYSTCLHTWILYFGMAPPKDIEVMFTDISGNFIAWFSVCPGATVGTFNAGLKGHYFRIPKGMQYVKGGLAYKASEPESRAFEGDVEINNKQTWHIVFSESLESSDSHSPRLPAHGSK